MNMKWFASVGGVALGVMLGLVIFNWWQSRRASKSAATTTATVTAQPQSIEAMLAAESL